MGPKKQKTTEATDYEKLMETFMNMRQSEWDYYAYKKFLRCPEKVEKNRRTKLCTQMKNGVCSDIAKLMNKKTLNDVTVKLIDGDIGANKIILMARSKYFSNMLSNKKFVEAKNNVVEMKTVKKIVMEKAIKVIYSGNIDIKGLDKYEVLQLLDLLRLLMLDNAFKWVMSTVEEPFDYNYEESRACDYFDEVVRDVFVFVLETLETTIDLKLDDLTEKYLNYIRDHTYEMFEDANANKSTEEEMKSSLAGIPFHLFQKILPLDIKDGDRKLGAGAKNKLIKVWIDVNEDKLEEEEKEEAKKHMKTKA